MTGLELGVSGWAALSLLWAVIMPARAGGRNWHYAHMAIPLIAYALYATVAPAALRTVMGGWFIGGLAGLLLLCIVWSIGTVKRNHGMMDVSYSLVAVVVTATAAWAAPGHLSVTAWIGLALLATWSFRLATQTLAQNHSTEREPYATWRARYPTQWSWWSFFQVHMLQGVMVWIWSLGLVFAMNAPANTLCCAIAIALWLVGFVFQTGADAQLTRFRANPANRGKVLDYGFWRIVRQPNYLGEAFMWWGYFVLGLAHPFGIVAIIAPVYMTWFMAFGSAGPYKERHMAKTRGAAWQAYCAITPRFFPFPRPRKSSGIF